MTSPGVQDSRQRLHPPASAGLGSRSPSDARLGRLTVLPLPLWLQAHMGCSMVDSIFELPSQTWGTRRDYPNLQCDMDLFGMPFRHDVCTTPPASKPYPIPQEAIASM